MNNPDVLVRSDVFEITKNESMELNLTLNTNLVNKILFGSISYICSNNTVSDIKIKLINVENNNYKETITNIYGEYVFFNLVSGEYLLVINALIKCIKCKVKISKKQINCYNVCIDRLN